MSLLKNQNEYRIWAETQPDLLLFARPWWLDIACGIDKWDAVIIKNRDEIIASMPYYKTSKFGIPVQVNPPLCPYTGPWIETLKSENRSNYTSNYWAILSQIADALPKTGLCIYHFEPSLTDLLPLHWKGFSLSTRYTFILDTHKQSEEVIWDGLKDKLRNSIRHAQIQFKVEPDPTVERIIPLIKASFDRKKLSFPVSTKGLSNLIVEANKNACLKSWVVYDQEGVDIAALCLAFQSDKAWILLQGTHAKSGHRGALNLLQWEAIIYCLKHRLILDFEGSMLEPVARNNGALGANIIPYQRVFLNNAVYKLWSMK
jgi:hypothetical protein